MKSCRWVECSIIYHFNSIQLNFTGECSSHLAKLLSKISENKTIQFSHFEFIVENKSRKSVFCWINFSIQRVLLRCFVHFFTNLNVNFWWQFYSIKSISLCVFAIDQNEMKCLNLKYASFVSSVSVICLSCVVLNQLECVFKCVRNVRQIMVKIQFSNTSTQLLICSKHSEKKTIHTRTLILFKYFHAHILIWVENIQGLQLINPHIQNKFDIHAFGVPVNSEITYIYIQ